jgi:hypothetical protein
MLLPVNLFISFSFNGMRGKPHQADHAFFCGDGAIEPVEIVKIRDVALNSRNVSSDLATAGIQTVLRGGR